MYLALKKKKMMNPLSAESRSWHGQIPPSRPNRVWFSMALIVTKKNK